MIESRLSEILGRRRLSVTELARQADVSRDAVARLYHDGAKQVDLRVLDRVCAALGVQPGDVLVSVTDEEER